MDESSESWLSNVTVDDEQGNEGNEESEESYASTVVLDLPNEYTSHAVEKYREREARKRSCNKGEAPTDARPPRKRIRRARKKLRREQVSYTHMSCRAATWDATNREDMHELMNDLGINHPKFDYYYLKKTDETSFKGDRGSNGEWEFVLDDWIQKYLSPKEKEKEVGKQFVPRRAANSEMHRHLEKYAYEWPRDQHFFYFAKGRNMINKDAHLLPASSIKKMLKKKVIFKTRDLRKVQAARDLENPFVRISHGAKCTQAFPPHLFLRDSPVPYQQKSNECVAMAGANLLHLSGHAEAAKDISKRTNEILDKCERKDLPDLHSLWVMLNMVFCVGGRRTNYFFDPKKIKHPHDFVREKTSMDDFTIMQLRDTSGHNLHFVLIHGGKIYDSNKAFAVPLSVEGLDACCIGESRFATFSYAVRLVRQPSAAEIRVSARRFLSRSGLRDSELAFLDGLPEHKTVYRSMMWVQHRVRHIGIGCRTRCGTTSPSPHRIVPSGR